MGRTADAVVYADERLVVHEGEGASDEGDGLEGCAHAGALCEAHDVDVVHRLAGLLEGLGDDLRDPALVVPGRVRGEEALAGRGDVGVADVAEDRDGGRVACRGLARRGGRVGRRRVEDEADSELVGGSLEAEGEERAVGRLERTRCSLALGDHGSSSQCGVLRGARGRRTSDATR